MGDIPQSQHAEAVRRQLVDLVRQQGPGLLDDGRRVRAMLADAVAGATAEANLIALAIAAGVPARLREAGHDPARLGASVDAVAQDLHRTSSVQAADARWAVEAIAEAMGLVTVAVPARSPALAPASPSPSPSGPGPHDLVLRFGNGQHVAASGSVVTIGRDPGNTVSLDSPSVSRLHARVLHGQDGWEYRDERSTQGSFVNGVAVTTFTVRGETEVTLGQGPQSMAIRLVPFGEAVTGLPPQRPRPQAATEIPGARPGGALVAGAAPPTQLGGGDPASTVTVTLGGASRTLRAGDALTIGREDDNGLVARHTTVSRHHARIEHAHGAWHLRDLGSTAGTWLAGRRIEAPVPLSGRQEFVLGDQRDGDRLVIQGPGSASTGAPIAGSSRGRRAGLIGGIAAALVLVGGAATYGAWQLIDDGGGDPPPETGTTATDPPVTKNDIARATVRVIDEEGGWRGSGVIIDAEKGLILTNAHVAAPSALGLAVYMTEFADEQAENPSRLRIDVSGGLDESAEARFYAKVVAVDGYLDVAVLQIETKLSGAPTDEDDLAGLTSVPLGDSDELSTSDDVSFYGYPGAAGSTAPTFTNGVVAGSVQDDRLDEFRAEINTTAAISGGNSGGPAVDESGKLVGLATWEGPEEAFSIIRPINLARPVIDAAVNGERYTSPWSERGPREARMPLWNYAEPGPDGRVTSGCTDTAAGGDPTTIRMEYNGFSRGPHTDVAAALYVPVGEDLRRVATSITTYPTKLPVRGCLTFTFDIDVPPGTYHLKIGVGGDLRLVVNDPDFTIE